MNIKNINSTNLFFNIMIIGGLSHAVNINFLNIKYLTETVLVIYAVFYLVIKYVNFWKNKKQISWYGYIIKFSLTNCKIFKLFSLKVLELK